ncbi:MAG: hypothetical protein PHT41_08210, partial [Candidatus Omnitrophica bacterium]|nr:hypothetical protein [Candidatus Omnitrophota bacterium]
MIILIGLLFGLSIYFLMYQFGFVSSEKAHLPSEIMANNLDSTLSRQATGEFQNKTWMSISRRFRPVE